MLSNNTTKSFIIAFAVMVIAAVVINIATIAGVVWLVVTILKAMAVL